MLVGLLLPWVVQMLTKVLVQIATTATIIFSQYQVRPLGGKDRRVIVRGIIGGTSWVGVAEWKKVLKKQDGDNWATFNQRRGSRADGGAEVLKSFMGNSHSNQQTGFVLDPSAHCHLDSRPISLEEGLVFCKFTKKQTENSWWLCLSECLFTGAIELRSEVGFLIRIDRSIQGKLYYGLKCTYIMQKFNRPRHYQLWCWQLWNRSNVLTPLMRGLLIHH